MKYALTAAVIVTALTFAGCGTQVTPPASSSTVPAAASQAVPADHEAVLSFYLPDADAMHIIRQDVTVKASQKTLKNGLYQMIQADRVSKYPMLPTGLTIKDVTVKNGTATINFSKQLKNMSGGTTTENLFVAMVVDTATEFPNVKQVVFQIEGQPIKKLTGHLDMSQPFKRDETPIKAAKK